MKLLRNTAVLTFAAILAVASLELGLNLAGASIDGFVSRAEARLGRPATPVSVAGAGRRTVRRCAAGVYNC
ncbi:hypothetical protein [Ruegeria sp. HKCCA5763]|uniref:hypothetical protein n=1 Tax=Ruegeria sp. HKCCA5763 TaxID=2682987 RepID=UPI001489D73F|nr:hypothetical protein [Ruegeria sp. HKCCA5763]